MKLYNKEVEKAEPYSLVASIILTIVLIVFNVKLWLVLPVASAILMMNGHFTLAVVTCLVNFLAGDNMAYLDEILQTIFVIVPIYKAFDTGQGFKQTVTAIMDSGKTTTANQDGFVIRNNILKKYKGDGGEVIIPEGVTEISGGTFSGAFEDCRTLTSVRMPESLKVIGQWAFKDCKALTSVEIPESVEKIYSSVFTVCSNLYSVRMPSHLEYLGGYAFSYCPALTSLEIPDGVQKILKHTFNCCPALEEVIIPASVTTIEEEAFVSCDNLHIVVCPTNTTIESNAFPKNTTVIRCNARLTSAVTQLCYDIIKDASNMAMGTNMGAGLIPGIGGKIAKAVSLPAIQINMIVELAEVFNQYINESQAQDILNQVNQILQSDNIATTVVSTALSFVPVVGGIASGAGASVKVKDAGWMAVSILSKNNT